MLKSSFVAASIAATALFSPSAAAAQEADVTAESESLQAPPRCVHLVNVNGYSVIDSEHLLLRASASRRYLVTLRSSCPELRLGIRVATSFGRTARICHPTMEYVTTGDGFRCRIEQVEEVESLEAARDLIGVRAAATEQTTGSR